jgi:hypothetical protein
MIKDDPETAAACMYALPRDGKKIEGGSVRLAEIVATSYGNLRAQSRIVSIDGEHVTAQGNAWDLESNYAVSIEKKRRITDRHGRRYSPDMIVTTANAASAIAFRDATLKAVPKAFWGPIYDEARRIAIGDTVTLEERRTKMLQYFAKLGVFEDRLLANLGLANTDEIGLEELEKLIGAANVIKDGQQSVDELFPPPKPEGEKLSDKLKAAKPKAEPAPAKEQSFSNDEIQCNNLRIEWDDDAPKVGTAKALEILQNNGIKSVLALNKETDPNKIRAALDELKVCIQAKEEAGAVA